jgi:hypothetical protein
MARFGSWVAAALAMVSLVATGVVRASPTTSPPATTGPSSSCTQTPHSIPNGGFERGSLNPWTSHIEALPTGYEGSVAIVPGGYKSEHAVQLNAGYSVEIEQRFLPTCEVTAYTISFAYKVLNSTSAKVCELYARASHTRFLSFGKSIPLHEGGGWQTNAFEYYSNLITGYTLVFGVQCNRLNNSASILLDDIQVTSAGSLARQGCPKTINLPNGGFDTGQIAPWVPSNFTKENAPKYKIVSPGYKSPYAFEMDFPASDFTDWYFGLDFDRLCDGSYYNVSWAINWVNYTGPLGSPAGECSVSVLVDGCGPLNSSAYSSSATTTPGWVQYSYVCQSGVNGRSNLDVDVTCDSEAVIPAFALRMDSFSIKLLSSAEARSIPSAHKPAPREVPTRPRGVEDREG